jgi:hypothetical protein
VNTPPEHEFEPHGVAEVGSMQVARVEPSQLATLHVGSVPVLVHAARPPCGSPLAGTGEQIPSSPETSHASHCPAQVELQQ